MNWSQETVEYLRSEWVWIDFDFGLSTHFNLNYNLFIQVIAINSFPCKRFSFFKVANSAACKQQQNILF